MSAEEFLAGAFGKDNSQEKIEHFEQSTIKLLLQRAGWSKGQIAIEAAELGESFTFDWFNDAGILAFQMFADRCFHFNLQELLIKPFQCNLLKQFHAKWLDEGQGDMAVVYKAFDVGRIVVSRGCMSEASSRPSFPCVETVMAPGLVVHVQPWAVFCNLHFSEEEDTDV